MIGVMIQTAFLVIAILAVQKVLGNKLHAYVRYSLWLLVVLRLIIPVNFINSPFSMLQIAETIQLSNAAGQNADLQRTDSEVLTDASGNHNDKAAQTDLVQTEKTVQGTEANIGRMSGNLQTGDTQRNADTARMQDAKGAAFLSSKISTILYATWLTGGLLVGGFLGFSHFRFRRKLRYTRTAYQGARFNAGKITGIPVYRVKNLESPCLVGLVRPAIYIGTDIDTDSDYFRYAIMHEEIHYLHKDHLWAFVRAALVTVYWFHPFVWIAAAHSVKDGEIACDYGTVRRLGQKEKFAYSEMLLTLSQIKRGKRVYSYGIMLHPSKSELKRRILRLTHGNGSRVWAGILAVLLMFVAAGCAFTGAAEINDGKTIQLVNAAGKDSTDSTADDNRNTVTDNGSAQAENGDPAGSGNSPDNEDTDMTEPRQLVAEPAEISLDLPIGADGPWLDYAGGMGTDQGSRIIFHDYFGLIVYDLSNRKIARCLALEPIGCDKTQGDDACQVAVSEDGATVWLHPMSKRYMYRYEVEENLLYQVPLVKTFELDLEGKDLFSRYSTLEEESTNWHSNYLYEQYKDEQGLHNAYIYLWASNNSDMVDSQLALRNLECVWDDMIFTLFEEDANARDSAGIPIEEEYFSHDPAIQDSADIPEEIQHERFQDNQTDGTSETANADSFPYNYHGNVVDVEITYDKPCNYTRISDAFGGRVHPITGEVRVHEGIDFSATEGTDIWAAADGVVYETGFSAEHGNYVVLRHINGDMTYYCHCQAVTVKKDDQVKRGDKIATVGSTGQSTGSHLHFALSRSGMFVNPGSYMEVVLDLN